MEKKSMPTYTPHRVTVWHILTFGLIIVLFIGNVSLFRTVAELTEQHNEVLDHVNATYEMIIELGVRVNAIEEELNKPEIPHHHPNPVLYGLLVEYQESIKSLSDRLQELADSINSMEEIWAELEFDRFTATAYSPFDNVSGIENDGDPTSTATGTYPDWGTFAVDPRVIPYYSDVLVIGKDWFEWGIALDTGFTMRKHGTWIDLYRDTYKQTLRFGLQRDVLVIWR